MTKEGVGTHFPLVVEGGPMNTRSVCVLFWHNGQSGRSWTRTIYFCLIIRVGRQHPRRWHKQSSLWHGQRVGTSLVFQPIHCVMGERQRWRQRAHQTRGYKRSDVGDPWPSWNILNYLVKSFTRSRAWLWIFHQCLLRTLLSYSPEHISRAANHQWRGRLAKHGYYIIRLHRFLLLTSSLGGEQEEEMQGDLEIDSNR